MDLSAEHLITVAVIVAAISVLVAFARLRPGRWTTVAAHVLALLILVNEVGWWVWAWQRDALSLQNNLPLGAEFLDGKYDFLGPDFCDVDPPHLIVNLQRIPPVQRRILKRYNTLNRIPGVIIDPQDLEICNERPDAGRL